MDNKLKVYNENNELEDIEIINFYQLEEYDHEYVYYTKNEEIGEDAVTYISILKQISNDEYIFESIENPEEEKKVKDLIDKDLNNLEDENV